MKNQGKSLFYICSALLFLTLACERKEEVTPLDEHYIIPLPKSVISGSGSFELDAKVGVLSIGKDIEGVSEYLRESFKRKAEISLEDVEEEKGKVILLRLDESRDLSDESYTLDIESGRITLSAGDPAGLFYGVQSLLQLIPADGAKNSIRFPIGRIEDEPTYSYRGMMLDVARHFFSVEDVKWLIDRIAGYKINHLHLHLSDDQGWRIEIKSWPLLATIGGASQVGGGKGGYYTQDDYREIVEYAQRRFITIVPEIDMPGHTNSILNAYGVLNPGITVPEKTAVPVDRKALGVEEVDPKATPYHTGIEVGFSTLDTKNPLTYQFVDDVIRELSELTPGPYIHIGGDESHVTELKDYIPFVERAQEIVAKYGKKSFGWDEIAHAKLLEGTVVQFWDKAENAEMAIAQGNKVLISPAKRVYMDMQYDSTTHLGLHWAAYIELDDAYDWDPTELRDQIKASDIFGVEAPLWTETLTNRSEIEYMIFPRLPAIAEVAWTPKDLRSWESFSERIKGHGKIWEAEGVNFYKSPKVEWE